MSRVLEICIDYLSPYAYLAWVAVGDVCERRRVELRVRPVLLAGLLERWGQLGPAEIPPKRQFVLRDASRLAARRGVPFRPPVSHPFNPLTALRVSLPEVAGSRQRDVVSALFHACWGEGRDLGDPAVIEHALAARGLDASGLLAKVSDPAVKAALRASTDDAISRGVFGVPTMIYDGQLFWGYDQMQSIADVIDGRDPIDAIALDAAAAHPLPIVRPRRSRD